MRLITKKNKLKNAIWKNRILYDSTCLVEHRRLSTSSLEHKKDHHKQTEITKTIFIKLVLLFALTYSFLSCNQEKKSNDLTTKSNEKNDTIIVKYKNELNNSYEVDFISKSYSYYWLVGNDTLDFSVNVSEYKEDSTLYLRIYHENPINFTTALTKINDCLPCIKEDFYLTKFKTLDFRDPIYYFDIVKEISIEYEKQYGQKIISYEKLNQFLLKSNLNKQIDNFVAQFDKKTKRYIIEKFQITDKKYIGNYMKKVNLTEYPEFVINGMGITIELESKSQNE